MGVKFSIADMQKLKLVQVNGGMYEKISRQQVKKEKIQKLPNMLERAQMQAIPENKIIGEDSKASGKLFIKALSNNKAWQGRRFKTDEHKKYCDAVNLLLPNNIIVPEGLLRVTYEFGLSNSGADIDNNIKSFQDILSKKYGFNDNKIMEANIKKVIVPKGQEYISFKIEKL